MRPDNRSQTGFLLPAPEPKSTQRFGVNAPAYIHQDTGTGGLAATEPTTRLGLWQTRFNHWQTGIEQTVAPRWRRYWKLWRAYDEQQLAGPGAEWRDRTVIPKVFEWIRARHARVVLAQFGRRNWFGVQGRGYSDEMYEEMVRTLIEASIDEIGLRDHHDGGFTKRFCDGSLYREVMGHVFWKVWWRHQTRPVFTQMPTGTDAEGKPTGWQPAEFVETIYDNVDVTWCSLDTIAIDLSGSRRWLIETLDTTKEQLVADDAAYFKETGLRLYDQAALEALSGTPGTSDQNSYSEPRDTERWPLGEESYLRDPAGTPVKLQLCWDNVEQTLTKIANNTSELAHGYAPTPDGLDPFISDPALPIPGRVYGESVIHYAGPLAQLQTRIARARMDEILLNIWQQFIFREGWVRNSQLVFRPGGAITVQDGGDQRPVTDHVGILPRRPVLQEAYQEEGLREAQGNAAAGADAITLGNEATQKSRDVAATEIQQRVIQASTPYQLEAIYRAATFKKPLLDKVFDLLQQNMTQARVIKVLEEEQVVDLRSLRRPIDIVLDDGLMVATRDEEAAQTQELTQLAQSPVFGPVLEAREIMLEWFENRQRRDAPRFVKSQEKLDAERQAELAAMAAKAGGGAQPAGREIPGNQTPEQGPQAAAPTGGGGRAALAGPSGAEPQAPPAASESLVERF